MKLTALGVLAGLPMLMAFGCSLEGNIEDAEQNEFTPSVDATEQAVQFTAVAKWQGDGSLCQWSNCGTTSAAMMRYAMTGGAENYGGSTMRRYYQIRYGIASNDCGWTAGGAIGTNGERMGALMENISAYDGGPNYASTTTRYADIPTTCASGSTFCLAYYLNPARGYVGYVGGSDANGQASPTGFGDPHAMYVHKYDPATGKFLVYDPNRSSSYSPVWWTATQLNTWRTFRDAIIGKGRSAVRLGQRRDGVYLLDHLHQWRLWRDAFQDICGSKFKENMPGAYRMEFTAVAPANNIVR